MTLFGNRDFDRPTDGASVHPIRTGGGDAFALNFPPVPGSRPAAPETRRRVLLRLHSGDDLVIGVADCRDSGVRLARETMRLIDDAEARGQWPELDGRYIRPDSIVSIDVQRVA